jgi:drug/metabolite transporter (DMT)-like permease
MTGQRIAGFVLLVIGIVVLMMGGVFWNKQHTVLDAGPVEVKTQHREGVALPPVLGGVAAIAGVLLLVIPTRRRV